MEIELNSAPFTTKKKSPETSGLVLIIHVGQILIAVMIRFVGTLHRYTDVFRLVFPEFGQLYA